MQPSIYPSLNIMRLLYVVRPSFFSHSAAVFLRSFIFHKTSIGKLNQNDLMKSIYRRCRQAFVDLDRRLVVSHSALNKYAITDHFPYIFSSALS